MAESGGRGRGCGESHLPSNKDIFRESLAGWSGERVAPGNAPVPPTTAGCLGQPGKLSHAFLGLPFKWVELQLSGV